MKLKIINLAFALGFAVPVLAADQTASQPANHSVSAKAPKVTIHIAKPVAQAPTAEKTKIERIGKMSSRPWPQIVGWRPGPQFAADAERYHEGGLTLLWIGSEPR